MTMYNKYGDQELWVRIKLGDEKAFIALYERYWAILYAHALKMLKDKDEAMDVVQDVFTHFLTKVEEIELSTSLKSYLYAAVRNRILNQINKNRLKDSYVNSLVDFVNQGYDIDDQMTYRDLLEKIEEEVNNLPPKMKKIFEMSRTIGLSHKTIAKELNITDHTVKKTINRVLKALKAKITMLFFPFI